MKTARQSVEEDSYTVSCWTVDRNKKKNRELPMTTVPLFKPNRFLSSFFFRSLDIFEMTEMRNKFLDGTQLTKSLPPERLFSFLKKYNL
jgi:hypothetical protein